jgi:hypothetical protein
MEMVIVALAIGTNVLAAESQTKTSVDLIVNEPATLRDLGIARLEESLMEFSRTYVEAKGTSIARRVSLGASAAYIARDKTISVIASLVVDDAQRSGKEICRDVLSGLRSTLGVNPDTGAPQAGGGPNLPAKHTYIGGYFSHVDDTQQRIATVDAVLSKIVSLQVAVIMRSPELKVANCKGALLSTESVVMDPSLTQ